MQGEHCPHNKLQNDGVVVVVVGGAERDCNSAIQQQINIFALDFVSHEAPSPKVFLSFSDWHTN